MSREKGSRKTRALEVSQHLVPRGVRVAQATTGYVLAKIPEDPRPRQPCSTTRSTPSTDSEPGATKNSARSSTQVTDEVPRQAALMG